MSTTRCAEPNYQKTKAEISGSVVLGNLIKSVEKLWRWKSKTRNAGRPKVEAEICDLIHRMSEENPLWGSPRIQAELRLLGFNVAESTVAKYRGKVAKPPSQTWKTFLSSHASEIAGIDFFTVPTFTFRNLYCFIVLLHSRRQIVHFNVTDHPTAAWTAQQMIEAFPEDSAPRFLLRDRDLKHGEEFRNRVRGRLSAILAFSLRGISRRMLNSAR